MYNEPETNGKDEQEALPTHQEAPEKFELGLKPSEGSIDIREVIRACVKDMVSEYEGRPSSILYQGVTKQCNPVLCMTEYAVKEFMFCLYGRRHPVEMETLSNLVIYTLKTEQAYIKLVVDIYSCAISYDIWYVGEVPSEEPHDQYAEFFKSSNTETKKLIFF